MKDTSSKPSSNDLDEYREMFHLVDVKRRGYVMLSELRRLLDMLHLSLTDSEFIDLFSDASDSQGTEWSDDDLTERRVVFDQFARIMSRRVQDDYTPEQLRNAFRTFESDDIPEGHVSTHMLHYALAKYGTETIPDNEIERLVASIDPTNSGVVDYIKLVDSLRK